MKNTLILILAALLLTTAALAQTPVAAPAGLVSTWPADGNAQDAVSGNNGTLVNGTSYGIGKVGQSFVLDGNDDYVAIPDSSSLEASTQLTIEAWIKPSAVGEFRQIVSKFGSTGQFSYQVGLAPNAALRTDLSQTGGPAYEQLTTPPNQITANVWNHVAVTFDSGTTTIYVNGVAVANSILPITAINSTGSTDVNIGRDPAGVQYFAGQIDEPSFYGRALTQSEVQSIYNAGIAGKLKQNPTPTGSNVAVPTGRDATVTFPNVTTAGSTEQFPIDLSTLPALPIGSTATGLAYDISTSAVYSGSPQICFNLPSITNSVTFGNLRIAHLEAGVWVNRTDLASINFATRTICTSGLTSLSPFAVVNGFGPTAAAASVEGRVATSTGRGIANVVMSITNVRTGETRSVRTATFGYYAFEGLDAGETYVLSATARKFTFSSPTRVLNVTANLANEDFIADRRGISALGQTVRTRKR